MYINILKYWCSLGNPGYPSNDPTDLNVSNRFRYNL